ncbi:MAG: hypothetical protein JW798_18570 [Prolixibacteraceae bacterium]|nr:hypothetical protein [Prolixibacteraceae bacterium]
MTTRILFTLAFIFLIVLNTIAQDDLEAMLLGEMDEPVEYAFGTFQSTNILNNKSTELLNKNGIDFRISHKFGKFNNGASKSFGFDDSNSLIEFSYAPADWWNIGIGRATLNESLNGYTKFRILRQSTGSKTMPVSCAILLSANYQTQTFDNEERNNNLTDRLEYASQILIARKFGSLISAQIMPTYVHRNLVNTINDLNDIFALGLGASIKVEKRLRINLEYFLVQKHNTPNMEYFDPLSLGICYQTSRHAFEVFVTNTNGITENHYIANTTNNFWKGDVRVGFNISTVFSINPKK